MKADAKKKVTVQPITALIAAFVITAFSLATELEGPKIFNMATGGKRLARPRNDRFESGNLIESRIECDLSNHEAYTQLQILYHTQFKRIYRKLVKM